MSYDREYPTHLVKKRHFIVTEEGIYSHNVYPPKGYRFLGVNHYSNIFVFTDRFFLDMVRYFLYHVNSRLKFLAERIGLLKCEEGSMLSWKDLRWTTKGRVQKEVDTSEKSPEQ